MHTFPVLITALIVWTRALLEGSEETASSWASLRRLQVENTPWQVTAPPSLIASHRSRPLLFFSDQSCLFPRINMEDVQYDELLNYHQNKDRPYPEEIYSLPLIERTNAKSKFRKRAKIFTVENDQLLYNELKVARKSELDKILEAFHDNPNSGGHFGRDKTLSKIKQEFYWKGMKSDILKYVNKCVKCFEVNPKLHEDAPPLNPILSLKVVGHVDDQQAFFLGYCCHSLE